MVQVTESPAAAEARDKLLAAIGREAEHVPAANPGQASSALVELARAYVLVTGGSAADDDVKPGFARTFRYDGGGNQLGLVHTGPQAHGR
ncbi:hypothetical protein ACFWA9_13280 [Kitasatospora sp. NPDC059973]|uniref:hypothetical protein n=1 Tax=Kitasatospora sp. NPDC059973 TaxID=3347020 RepID=UPI0036A846ED